MEMNEDVRQLLMRDLKKAEQVRNSTRIDQNYEVTKPRYLEPYMSDLVLPVNPPDGKMVYFQRLMEALEEALNKGFIPKGTLRGLSPRYVEDLLR